MNTKPEVRHALARLMGALGAVLFVLGLAATPACLDASTEETTQESSSAVGRRPVDLVERFPESGAIHRAMDFYTRDANAARMEPPIGVGEFFGQSVSSANINQLRIERLRPDPRHGGNPIAFLSAQFHGTDMHWNNRYKDVQLYKLFDRIGVRFVFPEAVHVPTEGRALVRIWTDYTPVSKGAPEGLHGEALRGEIARIVVSSYVAGNVDGPVHNGNNGGFARFRDVSGRELWRGVLIDNGASWNTPGEGQKPWNANLLRTGPIERASMPVDLVEGLIRIAQATRTELAEWSRFERIDDGARAVVEAQRARAREVLDHYGIEYARPGSSLRLPRRGSSGTLSIEIRSRRLEEVSGARARREGANEALESGLLCSLVEPPASRRLDSGREPRGSRRDEASRGTTARHRGCSLGPACARIKLDVPVITATLLLLEDALAQSDLSDREGTAQPAKVTSRAPAARVRVARLLDFGIAKTVGSLTREGEVKM